MAEKFKNRGSRAPPVPLRSEAMIVLDPPEPSPSRRVYDRSWSPSYWRGSLDEIMGAARAALEEIKRQHPNDQIAESVHLDFVDDSEQNLGSLDGLQDALPTIDIAEVKGFWIGFSVLGDETASATIKKSVGELGVSAKGSEAFASGMVATIKSRLVGGAEAGEQAASVPLRLIDWLLLALIPAVFIGVQIFCYQQFTQNDIFGFILLGTVVAFIPAMIAGFVIPEGKENKLPPRFALVPEGEQFPDEGEARTGPVWTAKAWFEKHPAVALLLVLVIGALLGRAADMIEF
jgi:hypothetical protein